MTTLNTRNDNEQHPDNRESFKLKKLVEKLFVDSNWKDFEALLHNSSIERPFNFLLTLLNTAIDSDNTIEAIFELLKFCGSDKKQILLLRKADKLSRSDLDKYIICLKGVQIDNENKYFNRMLDNLEANLANDTLLKGEYLLPDREIIEKYITQINHKKISRRNKLRIELLINPYDSDVRKKYINELIKEQHASHHKLANIQFFLGNHLEKKTNSSKSYSDEIRLKDFEEIDFPDNQNQIICLNKDSKNVLFVFTGNRGRLGLPITYFHNVFRTIDANIVYLKDTPGYAFTQGIKSLGKTRTEAANYLIQIAGELKAKNIYCFGNSSGGYGALLFGHLIGAKRICSIAGPTTFNHLYNIHDKRGGPERIGLIQKGVPDADLDLINVFKSSERVPEIICYYSKNMPQDVWQAERLKQFTNVKLIPVDDVDKHWLINYFFINGEIHKIINELVRE